MSDDELSDSIDELEELMAEYETKENNTQSSEKDKKPDVADKLKSIEVPMDKIVFGDKDGLINNLKLAVGIEKKEENDEHDNSDNDTINEKSRKRKPVWTDIDDDKVKIGETKLQKLRKYKHLPLGESYKDFLTKNYTNIVSQPKWADLARSTNINSDSDSEDEDLLRTVGFIQKNSTNANLPSNQISTKRLTDLNRATQAEGQITSIQFHPHTSVALVAGTSGVASLYSVDGKTNNKLHNIYFKSFPIKCARLMSCGTKAIFTSEKRNYYNYDLLVAKETKFYIPKDLPYSGRIELSSCGKYMCIAGRFGTWYLYDAVTNELIHSFQQEHHIAGMKFTQNSERFICSSITNEVYIYSLRQRRLEHKFYDQGCIKGNVLDLSPSQQLLATGSKEGAVNVYNYQDIFHSSMPKTEKTFLNLTTNISSIKFNHTSEMLAMSSNSAKGAVRIAHFPSATVFANFPGQTKEIGKIAVTEFSPNSGYLALGGEKKVSLFRLKHFKNY